MSRLKDRRQRHDPYYRKAKGESYAARSVYKLQELDQRFQLFRSGQRVLDLGCRPGSWLQYAAEKVGRSGHVVGLDRRPLDISLPGHVRIEVGDVMTVELTQLLGSLSGFDLVISDMAPDTTGIALTDQIRSVDLCRRALQLSAALGLPQGAFVGKILMGVGFDELLAEAKRLYSRTRLARPAATRKGSTEQYLVAIGRRALEPA